MSIADHAGTTTVERADGRSPRLFVSFAVADSTIANEFVDLMRLGCNLREEEVFLTARPSTIPPGEPFVDVIHRALRDSRAAALLLSPAYYDSRFCLAELGAIWGRRMPTAPILIPPCDVADLEGVQLGRQGLRIDSERSLDEIRDFVRDHLNRQVSTGLWNQKRDAFLTTWQLDLRQAVAPATSVPAERHRLLESQLELETQKSDELEGDRDRLAGYAAALRADNDRLRAGGDLKTPAPSLTQGDEVAEGIAHGIASIDRARAVLEPLDAIVREALFRHYHAKHPLTLGGPENEYDEHDARRPVEDGYLQWDEEGGRLVWPRFDQPEVEAAKQALDRVRVDVFGADSRATDATAPRWIRPTLNERYGIDDPKFELRPTWEALGFLD